MTTSEDSSALLPNGVGSHASPAARPSRIALEIDWENLAIGFTKRFRRTIVAQDLRPLLERIQQEGTLTGARAYADWTQAGMQYMARELNRLGIEPLYAAARTEEGVLVKNAADVRLAVEVVERYLADRFRPIDTFVIVSGDGDIVPAIRAVRRHGARVIAVAIGPSLSRALAPNVDAIWVWEHDIQPGLARIPAPQASDTTATTVPPPPAPVQLPELPEGLNITATVQIQPLPPRLGLALLVKILRERPNGCATHDEIRAAITACSGRGTKETIGTSLPKLVAEAEQRRDVSCDVQNGQVVVVLASGALR